MKENNIELKCLNCKSKINKDTKVCPNCGESIDKMVPLEHPKNFYYLNKKPEFNLLNPLLVLIVPFPFTILGIISAIVGNKFFLIPAVLFMTYIIYFITYPIKKRKWEKAEEKYLIEKALYTEFVLNNEEKMREIREKKQKEREIARKKLENKELKEARENQYFEDMLYEKYGTVLSSYKKLNEYRLYRNHIVIIDSEEHKIRTAIELTGYIDCELKYSAGDAYIYFYDPSTQNKIDIFINGRNGRGILIPLVSKNDNKLNQFFLDVKRVIDNNSK